LAVLGEAQLGSLARQGIWERLFDGLSRAFEGSELSLKFGPLALKPALRQGEGLKADLRAALRERPNQLRQFLHDFIREIAAAIHPRRLVIIVDDLEKYSAPTNRIAAVYQQMAELFFHQPDILSLPQCHTIYTVPPYLAFINPGISEVYGGRLRVLPSVKLRSRPPAREPHQPGIDALETVLAGRLELDRLFAASRPVAVTKLVSASGGNIRDLFALAKATLRVALGDRADGLAVVHLDHESKPDRRDRVVARFADPRDEAVLLAQSALQDNSAAGEDGEHSQAVAAEAPARPRAAGRRNRIPHYE
ncbi:MAG: hypothetical protein KC457_32790, partial [Myxococcales bacterium]|nr:hypothetical protein [Myxococcales bacterium]